MSAYKIKKKKSKNRKCSWIDGKKSSLLPYMPDVERYSHFEKQSSTSAFPRQGTSFIHIKMDMHRTACIRKFMSVWDFKAQRQHYWADKNQVHCEHINIGYDAGEQEGVVIRGQWQRCLDSQSPVPWCIKCQHPLAGTCNLEILWNCTRLSLFRATTCSLRKKKNKTKYLTWT